MKRTRVGLLGILLLLAFTLPVHAADPNMDGGGGGMGSGAQHSFWTPGRDGVRITLVDATTGEPLSRTFDWTISPPTNGIVHFGNQNKLRYRGGTPLTPSAEPYLPVKAPDDFPTIITSGSKPAYFEKVREFFSKPATIERICDHLQEYGNIILTQEELTGGAYTLMVEPIAYFKYKNVDYAITATEVALFDQIVSGNLRSWMASLTHKNQPLAMFLLQPAFEIPAWTGGKNVYVSNTQILNDLGVGFIDFGELPVFGSDLTATYRTGTEVITSVMLENTTGSQFDPDNEPDITFTIPGVSPGSIHVCNDVYIPGGDSRYVWAKWTTPDEPGHMVITIETDKGEFEASNEKTVTVDVTLEELCELEPPNPEGTDTNPGFSYSAPVITNESGNIDHTWKIWDAEYVPSSSGGDGDEDNGDGDDSGDDDDDGGGYWELSSVTCTVKLSVDAFIEPDEKVPTAGYGEMKSGYGVTASVIPKLTLGGGVSGGMYTPVQNVDSTFAEFYFGAGNRLLENAGGNWSFKTNSYSLYGRPVHFTPVWYPDDTYGVKFVAMDAWTPVGQLIYRTYATLRIEGSVFDDWHVRRRH